MYMTHLAPAVLGLGLARGGAGAEQHVVVLDVDVARPGVAEHRRRGRLSAARLGQERNRDSV
jgi:hypothetical protein